MSLLTKLFPPGFTWFEPNDRPQEGLTQVPIPLAGQDRLVTVHYRTVPGVIILVRRGFLKFHWVSVERVKSVTLLHTDGEWFHHEYLTPQSNVPSFAAFQFRETLRKNTMELKQQ